MNRNIKRVIIPKFQPSEEIQFFVPRFVKIMKGDVIEWVNFDIKPHLLTLSIGPKLIQKIPLRPNGRSQFHFKTELKVRRIDYKCAIHPTEQGTIVFYPKKENEMSNTERIRFLSEVFDIRPPKFLKHLESKRNE